MRRFSTLLFDVLTIGLVLTAHAVLAAEAPSTPPRTRPRKTQVAPAPSGPSGVARKAVLGGGANAGSPPATIKAFRNAIEQTVYEIKASRFDVSR